MRKLFPFLVLLISFCSCDKQNEINIKSIKLPEGGNELVEANNIFGVEVFQNILAEEIQTKNVMFSPLSLNIALLMTYNGADGTTAEDMKTTMGLTNLSTEEINNCYKTLVNELVTNDRKVELSIANSMWFDKNVFVYPEFIKTLEDSYNAEVECVDFSDASTVSEINSWVKKKTNGLIDKIIDNFQADEIMALLNAVYFNGKWHFDFDKNATAPQDFTLADSSVVQVDMMNQLKSLKTGYSEIYSAIELPYGQGNFVMDLFLPNSGFTTDDVIDTLSNFNKIVSDFTEQEVDLYLPKFQFEYKVTLNDILQALGMSVAFSDEADFSKMSDMPLSISRVLQKSYITVDEKGTEAASVTFVGIKYESMPANYIKFDRPFIFIIREVSTNTIIFVGKVADPR